MNNHTPIIIYVGPRDIDIVHPRMATVGYFNHREFMRCISPSISTSEQKINGRMCVNLGWYYDIEHGRFPVIEAENIVRRSKYGDDLVVVESAVSIVLEKGCRRERRLQLATWVCNQLPTVRLPSYQHLYVEAAQDHLFHTRTTCSSIIMPISRRKNPKEYKQFLEKPMIYF
jgi:hypothetical protein